MAKNFTQFSKTKNFQKALPKGDFPIGQQTGSEINPGTKPPAIKPRRNKVKPNEQIWANGPAPRDGRKATYSAKYGLSESRKTTVRERDQSNWKDRFLDDVEYVASERDFTMRHARKIADKYGLDADSVYEFVDRIMLPTYSGYSYEDNYDAIDEILGDTTDNDKGGVGDFLDESIEDGTGPKRKTVKRPKKDDAESWFFHELDVANGKAEPIKKYTKKPKRVEECFDDDPYDEDLFDEFQADLSPSEFYDPRQNAWVKDPISPGLKEAMSDYDRRSKLREEEEFEGIGEDNDDNARVNDWFNNSDKLFDTLIEDWIHWFTEAKTTEVEGNSKLEAHEGEHEDYILGRMHDELGIEISDVTYDQYSHYTYEMIMAAQEKARAFVDGIADTDVDDF